MSIGLPNTETDTSGKFNLTLREFRQWNADSFWNDAHPFPLVDNMMSRQVYSCNLRLRCSVNFKKKKLKDKREIVRMRDKQLKYKIFDNIEELKKKENKTINEEIKKKYRYQQNR